MTVTTETTAPGAIIGSLVYRFEGRLAGLNPIGLFADGIRFHNEFDGTIVAGPFSGGRISGLDRFLLRPDGVGELLAPEVIEAGEHRVGLDVRGYVVPPPGTPVPPLEAVLEPGFEPPDVDYRVTGTALAATTAPGFEHLNRTTVVIEGTVNLATGRLVVEARTVERA